MNKRNRYFIPAARYDFLTRFYDPVVAVTTRERTFKRHLIQQSNIDQDHSVLDLACGTGTLTIWIQQRVSGATVVGIDGDPKILALARQKARKSGADITFDHGLSTHIPYDDASFDRVLSSLFFHHLSYEDKVRTLQEVFRVLKPGGQFHVADWGKPGNALIGGLFFLVRLLDGFENTRENVEGKLTNLFSQSGFTDVRLRGELTTAFGTMALHSMKKPVSLEKSSTI